MSAPSSSASTWLLALSLLLLSLLLLSLAGSATAEPRTFETAEDAALGLVEASRAGDLGALRALVAKDQADELFELTDPGVKEQLVAFAEAADRRLTLRVEGDDRRVITVGYNAYAFPVPVVRGESGWAFDGEEGLEELLDRSIGWNELVALSILRDFASAQAEYAAEPRDGTEVRQYARHFLSTPGQRDGLYWESDEEAGEEPSPFGPLVDAAQAEPERGAPYYGYHYRVLTRQGKHAPGGKHSYEINGHLIAGFAAVAWPAKHGTTGIKTFLINHYGVVYEKDLGDDTEKHGKKIEAYDLGEGWEISLD